MQFITQGAPGPTTKLTSSDVATNFSDSLIKQGTIYAQGILITCETNPIRFALGGTTPTQAGVGHILPVNGSLRLTGPTQIRSFSYISQTAGQAGVLQVTPEWI